MIKYPVKSAHTNRYRPHCTVSSLVLQIKSFVLLFSNFKKKDRVVVLKNSREHDWVAKWLDEINLWIDKVALSLIIILVYEFGTAQYKVFSVTLKQNKRSPESENKKNKLIWCRSPVSCEFVDTKIEQQEVGNPCTTHHLPFCHQFNGWKPVVVIFAKH